MQEHEAAPKSAEKTRMAAPKCATEKKFRQTSRTKSIDVIKRTTGSRFVNVSPSAFSRKEE